MTKTRISEVFLCLFLIATLVMIPGMQADAFTDAEGHWAEAAIQRWHTAGVVQGDQTGFHPNAPITRAEMASILDRLMDYQTLGSNTYVDVPSEAWYAEAILRSAAAGVLEGDGMSMRPLDAITRQEALTLLGRALAIPTDTNAISVYNDASQVADWAAGYVGGLTAAGYLQGNNGMVNPRANITRAEVVTLLDKAIGQFHSLAGQYQENSFSNLIVNTDGINLSQLTVAGNLIVAEGLADGSLVLDNVQVLGQLVVRGGGIHSIIIKGNSNIPSISIERKDGPVRVLAEDGIELPIIQVNDGQEMVKIEGTVHTIYLNAPIPVEIEGQIGTMEIHESAVNTTVSLSANTTVDTLRIEAAETQLQMEEGANIGDLSVHGDAIVISGNGNINNLDVQAGETISVDEDIQIGQIENNSGQTIEIGGTEIESGETGSLEGNSTSDSNDEDSSPLRYKVSFDSDGGSEVNSQMVRHGKTAEEPEEPTKAGYEFVAWLDGDVVYDFSTPVTESLRLTAAWQWDGTSVSYEWYGDGTAESYSLSSPMDLKGFANIVNGDDSQTPDNFANKTVVLEEAINLGNKAWKPIGVNETYQFHGSFDGGQNLISNLSVSGYPDVAGLFGWKTDGALQNIWIDNADIQGTDRVGTVVGAYYLDDVNIDQALLTGCQVSNSSIYGLQKRVGGIVGNFALANCQADADIRITDNVVMDCEITADGYTGEAAGIAAQVWNESANLILIKNNTVSDTSVQSASQYFGGVLGRLRNEMDNALFQIENCHAENVTVSDTGNGAGFCLGGIAGGCYSLNGTACYTFTNCSVKDSTISTTGMMQEGVSASGGLVGYNNYGNLDIENCTVDDTTVENNADIGGVLGHCTSTAKVSIADTDLSGLTVRGLKNVNRFIGNHPEAEEPTAEIIENCTFVSGQVCTDGVCQTYDEEGLPLS